MDTPEKSPVDRPDEQLQELTEAQRRFTAAITKLAHDSLKHPAIEDQAAGVIESFEQLAGLMSDEPRWPTTAPMGDERRDAALGLIVGGVGRTVDRFIATLARSIHLADASSTKVSESAVARQAREASESFRVLVQLLHKRLKFPPGEDGTMFTLHLAAAIVVDLGERPLLADPCGSTGCAS